MQKFTEGLKVIPVLVTMTIAGCSLPTEVMCENHCWHIRDCASDNDPAHRVDSLLSVDECFLDCQDRWSHGQLKDAYSAHRKLSRDREMNRGVAGCEYMFYFARRYGDGAECIEGVQSVAVDGNLYDCYVR